MTSFKDKVQNYLGSPAHLEQKHVHPRLMKMLKMGGMNVPFFRAEGYNLYDADGNRYLDMLSGGGIYIFGRNHPKVNAAIRDVADMDLPNLCVVNASVLGGMVAEKLLKLAGPGFSKVQYSNSGSEATEVAIRFSRFCTRRRRYLFLEGAFHGRTYGAISLCGFPAMNEGMDPKLPTCTPIRPNDIGALRAELSKGDVAALFVEPVQGMTLTVLEKSYLQEAARLCKAHGTLLVCDEIQTGLGRMGEWFSFQEAGIVPDIVNVSKILSGGQVPVAATLVGDDVYNRVFKDFKSGPLYFSTFAENNLAMAAAYSTLEILEEMDAPRRATEVSQKLKDGFNDIATRYDVIDKVVGKGLMLGVYFKQTESSPLLKAQQAILGAVDSGTFGAAVNVEMFIKHRIIVQIPGPGVSAIKILPPVTLSDEDITYFLGAFEDTLAGMYATIGGPAVSLGKTAVKDAVNTVLGKTPGKKAAQKKKRPTAPSNP